MVSYLDLPNELIALIVTDWLSWKAVGRLDSAICSKNTRNQWLDLLKKDCIFRCVNVGYDRKLSLPNNDRWCISRQICTSEFFLSMEKIVAFDQEAVITWLQNTAPLITTVQVTSFSGKPVSGALGVCSNLRKFCAYNCRIDDMFWMTVLNNPNLEDVLEFITELNFVVPVPTNLSIFKIKKLELGLTLTSTSDVALLFQHLPALECLKLVEQHHNVSCIYDLLPHSCPKLAYLDLKSSDHSVDDDDCFLRFIKSLKCGLRSLLLPAVQTLSMGQLQPIANYHSHSICCLSISYTFYPAEGPESYTLADLINSLPHLHTLSLCVISFGSLPLRKKIINPTITHLMLDLWSTSTTSLCTLAEHCPAATTLSLNNFNHDSFVVWNITKLLELRLLIHTVCVDRDAVIVELREAVPTVTVRKSTLIDIFEQDC